MATISPVTSAIPSPIAAQPQADPARDAQRDTRRVNAVESGNGSANADGARTSNRDAQARSERSGQFSNTGTVGTRGGDSGLLSRGAATGADNGRETRAGRADARTAEAAAGARTQTVREEAAPRGTVRSRAAARVVSRTEIDTSARTEPDNVKTERFVETLTKVRAAEVTPDTSEQHTEDVSNQATLGDAAEVSTGRYDKRA